MVLLASWCAMRFGELAELRRMDIDLSQEVIHVTRGVVRVGGKSIIGTPKTDAGIRDVAIPPHLIPAIEDHLAKHVGETARFAPVPNRGWWAPDTGHAASQVQGGT